MVSIYKRRNTWHIHKMFLLCLVWSLESKPICLNGTYFDEDRKQCLKCANLKLCTKGSPLECSESCAVLKGCPVYFYYDVITGACTSCAELCHQAEVRGTEARCRQLCPVDVPESLSSSTPKPHDISTTTEKQGIHTRARSQNAVMIVSVLILTTVIIGIAVLFLKRKHLVNIWEKCSGKHLYSNNPVAQQDIPP